MAMNNYLSIITFNVNGLNAPIKGHRTAEWIRKHDPPQDKRLTQMEIEGLETNFLSNWRGKKKQG